jgi:hypothetical protein
MREFPRGVLLGRADGLGFGAMVAALAAAALVETTLQNLTTTNHL